MLSTVPEGATKHFNVEIQYDEYVTNNYLNLNLNFNDLKIR